MEHSHDTREHLWGDILIDLRVLILRHLLFCPKNVICEAHDLILIIFSGEKTLLRAVVLAFFVGAKLRAHEGSRGGEIFFLFEWDVTEKDTNIFALNEAIIIKIVPRCKRIRSNEVYSQCKNLTEFEKFSENLLN